MHIFPAVFFILLLFAPMTFASLPVEMSTNLWLLTAEETIESPSFVLAQNIEMNGQTLDDSFWLATERANLNGTFGNDAWLLASSAGIRGVFADHARVVAQTIEVNGTISNGLWAACITLNIATNASLYGRQLFYGGNLMLNGSVEGDLYAWGRSITLGGTVVGNVHLFGDDIIIRPGTRIIGNLYYMTTNQSIVLDAKSQVSGEFKRLEKPVASAFVSPTWLALLQLFLFSAALLVGIPFMLMFPNVIGKSVILLKFSLWKCGLAGIATLFGIPIIMTAAVFTLVGVPLALVLGAAYGLILYLGKITVAIALGTALINRRGELSLAGAFLALVIGLFLFYSVALFPYVGSSLQTVASVFGAGSLALAMAAGRGKIKNTTVEQKNSTTE